MEILILLFGIEFSCINGANVNYDLPNYSEKIIIYDMQGYVTFDIGIELFELLYIKGSAKILIYLKNDAFNFDFCPGALSSFIEAGLKLKGFNIGYRHICIHPIVPFMRKAMDNIFVDQYASELFIKYETKVKVF